MTAPKHLTRCLVTAGCSAEELKPLLSLARTLAAARKLETIVAGLVVLPEQTSLSAGARAAQELRTALAPLVQGHMRLVVRVTHNPVLELDKLTCAEDPSLLLVNAKSSFADQLARAVPCNLVLVKGTLPRKLERILLPIRGGPYAALALELALEIAEVCAAEITLLHATARNRARKRQTRELYQHLRSIPRITRRERAFGNAADAILELADAGEHQLLVMGAAARPPGANIALGPIATRVQKESPITTLVVKTPSPKTTHALDAELPPVDYTISVVVDKWFAENTFHAHEFADIGELVRLKEQQGLSISLGLPTLNEEKTIGRVIRTMRHRFVEQYPLLDEIVVIDSNSTDRTVEIAENLGIPVVKHPQVLTQYGAWVGKGEALWNSLYILRGDLIAWIDTDIVNIHPRFVYGILGPLLREPRLVYVKGFYQRPLRIGHRMEARGGGRVTELVARPLLNLFYPELSGFVQPLAGEYAGRRSALEQVPFFVGYGVETGLLIDLWSRFGLDALGQVDLEERVHRNQSLLALSKMAFEITQVVMQRVGQARGTELIDTLHSSMKLIRYEASAFQLDVADIRVHERPPMIQIPEYRALRGIKT